MLILYSNQGLNHLFNSKKVSAGWKEIGQREREGREGKQQTDPLAVCLWPTHFHEFDEQVAVWLHCIKQTLISGLVKLKLAAAG